MKKIYTSGILILSMLFSLFTVNVFADDNISVYIDEQPLYCDVEPFIENGRTMVPMRKIFEEMGTNVVWEDETQTAIATNELCTVTATINSNTMSINGTPKLLDVSPKIVNGRTFVPARFVAEALGADVKWDDSTSTVFITSMKFNDDKEFISGYEKADIGKVNEYISEGEEDRTKLYINCKIESIETVYSNDENIGYFIFATATDDNENEWTVFLNSTALTNGNEHAYDEFIGKWVTIIGFYNGYLEIYESPVIATYKIRNNITQEIKSGLETILVEETNQDKNAVNIQTMHTVDGKTAEISVNNISAYEKLCWYVESVSVMYANDGTFSVISKNEIDNYKSKGWHTEPVVLMYAADGRTMYVEQSKVKEQETVGWYSEPVITMYAADGRTTTVKNSDIEAYKNVGWYLEPVTLMYAADGRTMYVGNSEIEAYKNVGWYLSPVTTVYAPDGRTMLIYEYELSDYLNVGWYKTYEAAKNSITPAKTNSNYTSSNNNQPNSGGSAVYRTPKGKRYHFDPNCGGKNSYKTTLQQAKSAGLTPCQKCAQ